MGLLTAMNIADRAWTKANDATGGSATRWLSSEALMWLRDAERQIVVDLPRANTLRATPAATAGTRQTLTGLGLTSGFQVTDVVCNYNAAGTDRGRPITKIDRIHLDEMRPGWHSETGDEAEHWVEDTRDPKTFYLWPSVYSAGGRIEILYPALPTDIASINATFTIGDEFAEALQFYLLFSFFSKDATFAKSPQIAATYRSLYQQALGMRGQNIAGNSALGDTKAKGA